MAESKVFPKVFCRYYSCGRRIGILFDEKENLLIGGKYRQPQEINSQESDEHKKDFEKYIHDKEFIKIIESNSMLDGNLKYLKEKDFIEDFGYENLLKTIIKAEKMSEEGVIK